MYTFVECAGQRVIGYSGGLHTSSRHPYKLYPYRKETYAFTIIEATVNKKSPEEMESLSLSLSLSHKHTLTHSRTRTHQSSVLSAVASCIRKNNFRSWHDYSCACSMSVIAIDAHCHYITAFSCVGVLSRTTASALR